MSETEQVVYAAQVQANWTGFLAGSESGHAVQVYAELDELAASVASYLAAGFELGEPAIVVATPEHLACFRERLAAAGWDAATVERTGLLVTRDADAVLGAITRSGSAPTAAFETVVGGLLDEVSARSPGRTIRVFGEMVDLLCRRGEATTAALLEELWNDLARTRRFSLLCCYGLDIFDRAAQAGPLPHICAAHSHVLPAPDPSRLGRAVDLALEDVLGLADAGKVYGLAAREERDEHVPLPQVALMWVSANMPALAERILAAARTHYAVA